MGRSDCIVIPYLGAWCLWHYWAHFILHAALTYRWFFHFLLNHRARCFWNQHGKHVILRNDVLHLCWSLHLSSRKHNYITSVYSNSGTKTHLVEAHASISFRNGQALQGILLNVAQFIHVIVERHLLMFSAGKVRVTNTSLLKWFVSNWTSSSVLLFSNYGVRYR